MKAGKPIPIPLEAKLILAAYPEALFWSKYNKAALDPVSLLLILSSPVELESKSFVTSFAWEMVRAAALLAPPERSLVRLRPYAFVASIEVEASKVAVSVMSSKSIQSVQFKVVTSVAVKVAAEPIVNASLPNVNVGSVAPASNVQTMPLPEPKVVVPISVVSKFKVSVSVAEPTVSIPFVPPAIVKVSP